MAIGNRRRSKNKKTVFNLVKQAATIGVVSTLQSSTVDWSIANVYTKQIISNETLEFVNDEDGKTIYLVLENTSESPVTISFPGGLYKSSSLQDTLQAGTQSIYTLVKSGNDIYITQDIFTDLTSFADTDGDGVIDNLDAFPNDPTESVDSDADGVGDNLDAFPLDATETLDTDGDGVGDNSDNAPLIANPDQADLDQDGIADVLDPDIDGDSVENDYDPFPNDPQFNYLETASAIVREGNFDFNDGNGTVESYYLNTSINSYIFGLDFVSVKFTELNINININNPRVAGGRLYFPKSLLNEEDQARFINENIINSNTNVEYKFKI